MQENAVESPISKQKYRLVQRDLKEIEKISPFEEIILNTLKNLSKYNVPQKIHWRVYLDLADIAKRESKFEEARTFFKLVVSTQPFAYQGWLEYSKMEEECGNQEVS